jgi:hypothetical protein
MATPAYAKGGEDTEEIEIEEIEVDLMQIVTPIFEPTPSTEPTPPPQPLTPPGNLTLVDDFSNVPESDKQFITVVTRNGHYFYIIIDRAGDRQNVHFLNIVEEYDLWAILDDDAPRPTTPTPIIEPTPEVTPTPEPEEPAAEEKSGGIGGIVIMLVLLGAIGGGAYYYFKVLKPGQAATKTTTTELDEFVFDEDEEDYGGEYSGADFEGDTDDMPDFTASPDTEPFNADFDTESEGK